MLIKLPSKFEPLFKPKRYKVYYGGRGGVKSWSFAQALEIIGSQKKTRVLCAREYQGSIQESVHKLLSDTADRISLPYDIQKTIIKNQLGSEFIFEGLKSNPTKIKSTEGVDIAWVEEAESISDKSWDLLIPTIRKEGSEIWISFNPDDAEDPTYKRFVEPYIDEIEKNGFYEDENIYVCYVGYWDNPWLPKELKNEMELCKKNDPKKYDHIWLGKPDAQNEGAYYADMMKRARDETPSRICSIPVEQGIPVNTFWDLGRNDATSIWFHQQVGKEQRFIDHYEMNGEGLQHYARILKEKDYFYGSHYLPHDVEVTELTTNMSRKETLESLGVKPLIVVPRVRDVNEGIEMTRQKIPVCWFDELRCKDGIRALTKYHKEWDDKRQVFRSYPLHDWSSNSADAFRQFAQGYTDDSVNEWGNELDIEPDII